MGRWALLLLAASPAFAQTDEIQVYDAEIAAPREVTLTLHQNYTPVGRKVAAYPGGIATDRTLNGVTEFAVGITRWWELGAYAPAVYSVDGSGRFWFDGVKLRSLFVVPPAVTRPFYLGCNIELGYNRPQWSPSPWQLEVRPIAGVWWREWELTVNPIVDLAFSGALASFAPASHLLRHLTARWTVGIELYQDFGQVGRFANRTSQQHEVFGLVAYVGDSVSWEFGAGAGLTAAGSDPLVLKLIVSPRIQGSER